MPQYRVVEKSFIGNKLCEEGEIVEYDGKYPGPNLEPADKAAEKVKAGVNPAEVSKASAERQKAATMGVESKDLPGEEKKRTAGKNAEEDPLV